MAPKLFELVDGDRRPRHAPRSWPRPPPAGDETVAEAIVRAAGYLGIGVANVVVTLHPELIVLGGGVAQIGELLLRDRSRATDPRAVGMFPTDGVAGQALSALGDQAGALGGIALAIEGGLLETAGVNAVAKQSPTVASTP